MNGFILYEGPSQLDGAPIVCIVTDPNQARINPKTQTVVQTYILRADIAPIEAIKTGADSSICGDCIHRSSDGKSERSCYVQVWGSIRNIWLAYKRGKYERGPHTWDNLIGQTIRLGSYGDPAAVPVINLDCWLRESVVIGYTHQWLDLRFANLKRWCMASCESASDVREAHKLGWRTFRVRTSEQNLMPHEIACPASAEAGHKSNCAECKACGGLSSKARCNIAIIAHGDKGKVRAFERKVLM